ncbi:MAG: NUDIX domain-containing protein [Candidatus Kaiserbacteria bacterium]|nr:NUDIX domain-containing protein [Candidatus Kaiserbacteria bacterium]
MAAVTVVLSLKALIVKGKKILLVRRSLCDKWNPGKWEFPGGKADRGECFDASLLREVFEETSLRVKIFSGVSFVIHEMSVAECYKGIPRTILFRVVTLESGEVQLSHEHCDFVWISGAEALAYDLTTETQKALEGLQQDTCFLQ